MCVVIPDCTSCKNFKGKNKTGLSTVVPFYKEFLKSVFGEIYM